MTVALPSNPIEAGQPKPISAFALQNSSCQTRRWLCALLFVGVFAVVFLEQTHVYWRHGQLLAGIHADGPFHFYCEMSRLSPDHFPNDLAVQSNQSLGF